VAAAIEAGMCFVNSQNVRDLRQPFGGTKASGTGREGGTWSYEVFCEPKNVAVSWAATTSRTGEFEMHRRHLLQALGAACCPACPAQAPAWPPAAALIVPFPPGGTTDWWRAWSPPSWPHAGPAVVVDNKPGAGTVIGVDAGAKAAPDG
jgi:hypothetical protein